MEARKHSSILAVLVCLVALMLVLSAEVFAAEAYNEGSKKISVGVQAHQYQPEESDSYTTVAAQLGFGYFVIDNLEVGLSGTVMMSLDGYESTTYAADLLAKYYFTTESKVAPYVGAQAGMSFTDASMPSYTYQAPVVTGTTIVPGQTEAVTVGGGDYDDSGWNAGLMLGVDVLLTEQASFFAEYNAKYIDYSDSEEYLIDHGVLVGLAYYF